VIHKIAGVSLLALVGMTSAAVPQTRGLPVPTSLAPTIYSAPTPAPLAPPINPGPATVPPSGLSPLLTQPGPVAPDADQAMPAYPAPQLPGPTGEQNMEAYRNSLLQQQRDLERSGLNPDSEISREIQQQLNQPASR
jgi:hypothetical protein